MLTLNDVEIEQDIIKCLRKSRITTLENILALSKEELAAKARISADNVLHLYSAISKKLTVYKSCSLFSILNNSQFDFFQHPKLSIGCPILDECFRGGLLLPGVNEVSGESGSGKTQIALQLCLTAQLSEENGGLNGGALFISTEDIFPTKRLHQLAVHMQRKLEIEKSNLMDSIYIEHAADVDDLRWLVNQRIPTLLKNSNVRLIVIDSIAALFRVEFTMNENIERSKALADLGQKLHRISHEYSTAVVCINQISDVIVNDRKGEDIGGRRVVPALGLSWSYVVTMRALVMRTPYTLSNIKGTVPNKNEAAVAMEQKSTTATDPVVRKLKVLFAPHIPNNECHYIVDEKGVHGVHF